MFINFQTLLGSGGGSLYILDKKIAKLSHKSSGIRFFSALNLKTELAVIQGKWDSNFRIEWSKWMDNKGVVACCNEKTVNILSKMVKDIVINGQSFRAWPPKELKSLTTLILPKGADVF